MPDYRTMFDSKWIRAWDLGGKDFTMVIERVEAGSIDNFQTQKKDRAPILWFKGAKKPLLLNKTNSKTIAQLYGTNTDEWVGKAITLFGTTTSLKGETVDCIRIRPMIPKAAPTDMPERKPEAA